MKSDFSIISEAYSIVESRENQFSTDNIVSMSYDSIFNGRMFDRYYALDSQCAMFEVCLNGRGRPLSNPVPIFKGTCGRMLVHPREILHTPVSWGSNRIVLIDTIPYSLFDASAIRYHLGGVPLNERDFFDRISECGKILGISVDNLVHLRNDGRWCDVFGNGNIGNTVSHPRVHPDDDTSPDLWDSEENGGGHRFERNWRNSPR